MTDQRTNRLADQRTDQQTERLTEPREQKQKQKQIWSQDLLSLTLHIAYLIENIIKKYPIQNHYKEVLLYSFSLQFFNKFFLFKLKS